MTRTCLCLLRTISLPHIRTRIHDTVTAQNNYYNPYVDEQHLDTTAGNSLKYCKWRGTITEVLVYLDTLVFPSTCIYPIPFIGRPNTTTIASEDKDGYGHAGYDDGILLIEKINAGTLKAGTSDEVYVPIPMFWHWSLLVAII